MSDPHPLHIKLPLTLAHVRIESITARNSDGYLVQVRCGEQNGFSMAFVVPNAEAAKWAALLGMMLDMNATFEVPERA